MSRALLLALNCLLPVLLLCGLLSCLLCRSLLGCFLRRCLLGNCLLCRSLLGNCLLGGGFLYCFLNCQLFYTSFSGFTGALLHHGLLGLGLSALGASVALFCGGFLGGLPGHNLFLRCLLCSLLYWCLLGSLLRRCFLGCLLCGRLLGRSLLHRGFLLGGLLHCRHRYRYHNRDHSVFDGYLIVIRGGKYAGSLDFFFFVVCKVFDPLGVQLYRLPSGIAVAHRIHPDYIFHPNASSGSPLHSIC